MATLFTKIINGEIPSYKIAETDDFYAMLDIAPNSKGHTLCIPKKEVDKLFDLDETTYNNLFSFSRKVAAAIKKTVDCERVGLAVVGLEVPHVHVHLIPLNTMGDMNFSNKVPLTAIEMKELATKISSNF